MQATRWAILNLIKERGQATVEEIGEALGLATITVRHHLAILEKDNLLVSFAERGGVGRPRHVYRLTARAEDLFPKKYHLLAERLLAELKQLADQDQLRESLERIARDMAASYQDEVLAGAGVSERLEALVKLLAEEGFLVQWEQLGDEYILKACSCPYYYVSQRHPEVCQLDLHLIKSILDTEVERRSCMVRGGEACTYRIVPSE